MDINSDDAVGKSNEAIEVVRSDSDDGVIRSVGSQVAGQTQKREFIAQRNSKRMQ